jgi:hypothetical protein
MCAHGLFTPKPSALRGGEDRSEDLTVAAHLHFRLPVPLHFSMADGPVDEPAQMADLELPGRATLSRLRRALKYGPTFRSLPGGFCVGEQEEELPFDVDGDLSPALLKALDGLEGGSQDLGQLLLGFSQLGPDIAEFIPVHIIILFAALLIPQSGLTQNVFCGSWRQWIL